MRKMVKDLCLIKMTKAVMAYLDIFSELIVNEMVH